MSEFPLGPAPGALWREGFPPPFRVRGQRSQGGEFRSFCPEGGSAPRDAGGRSQREAAARIFPPGARRRARAARERVSDEHSWDGRTWRAGGRLPGRSGERDRREEEDDSVG